MNEKLKELPLRAGGAHYPEINPHLQEAFARLIVEECAKIVESQDVDPAFKLRMSWAIKERFGFNNG